MSNVCVVMCMYSDMCVYSDACMYDDMCVYGQVAGRGEGGDGELHPPTQYPASPHHNQRYAYHTHYQIHNTTYTLLHTSVHKPQPEV